MANTLYQNVPQPYINTVYRGLPAFSGGGAGSANSGGNNANSTPAPSVSDSPPLPSGVSGGGTTGAAANPFLVSGFPTFTPVKFPTIKPAPYNFTDPVQYSNTVADNNRTQIKTNFGTAQDMALESLDTELKGLQGFAPAAAALSRQQTALDNSSNQAARTSQVNSTLPGAQKAYAQIGRTLDDQAGRAATYAKGKIPDVLQDSAFELGIRSRAADRATFSGFGGESAVARGLSDNMSAEQRLQIAQYGESLTGSNISQRENAINNEANLFLSPTEYSQTGSQIRPTPTVSGSQLTAQNLGALNEATLLSPAAALSSEIGQNQFTTQLDQQTRMFNAQGQFNAAQFNSTGGFAAALGAFDYKVSYTNALAGANQQNLNAAFGLESQGMGLGQVNSGIAAAQGATQLPQIASSIGTVAGATGNILGVGSTGTSPVGSVTPATPAPSAPVSNPQQPSLGTVSGGTNNSSTPAAVPVGSDGSAPGAVKFAAGGSLPSGYTPIATNTDGSVSAVSASDYKTDLARFAQFANVPSGTISPKNAAIADKNLSSNAGLSYLPVPGMQAIAVASNGQPVYSLKSAAEDGNYTKGGSSVVALKDALASLGVNDPKTFEALSDVAGVASNPELLSKLDTIDSRGGDQAVAKALLQEIGRGVPSAKSDAGQQLIAGASRIGQLWSNLSPAQKSLAVASLANSAAELRSGKKPGDHTVPGTEKSTSGALRVGDVINMSSRGVNGWSAARNWNQIADISTIGAGARNPQAIGSLAQGVGLLGFGAQGAAASTPTGYLKQVGAQPAPELGIGAMAFQKLNHVPSNYQVIRPLPTGGVLAIPKNLSHTSTLGGASDALAYERSQQIAAGSHPAQRLWGDHPSGGVIRGSAGGSALIAGLRVMHQQNPALFSAVVANSLFQHQMGTA